MDIAPYQDITHDLLDGEVWREHPRYPGYFISNYGRVRGRSGLLLRQSPSRGYLRVAVIADGQRKDLRLHQAVLEAFVGPRPAPEMESSHMDGNPLNNRADNLKWCTKAENAQQRTAHGRSNTPTGEQNPNNKICTYAVNLVRALCVDRGMSFGEVARISGMPAGTVAKIAQGRRRLRG